MDKSKWLRKSMVYKDMMWIEEMMLFYELAVPGQIAELEKLLDDGRNAEAKDLIWNVLKLAPSLVG